MNLYRLENEDPDRFDGLSLVKARYDALYLFGKPAVGWKAPAVKLYKQRARASLYHLSYHPVVTEAALALLAPLLAPYVQVLPLALGKERIWLLNVTHGCAALDRERAELHLFQGEHILEIRRYAFHEDRVDAPIFVLTGAEAQGVYCTDALRELVAAHGLRGWGFVPVSGAPGSDPPAPDDATALLQALLVRAIGGPDARWPPEIRALVHAATLDREVLNGGFSQYLYNTRGESLGEATGALSQLAPAVAPLLDELVALWEADPTARAAFFRAGVFSPRSKLANAVDRLAKRYPEARADLAILDEVDALADEIRAVLDAPRS